MNYVRLTGRLVCANVDEAATVAKHLPRHIELTRAEPGCLAFEVQPTDDPLTWTVAELFASEVAFKEHQERVQGSAWGRATAGIVRDYVITTHHECLGFGGTRQSDSPTTRVASTW